MPSVEDLPHWSAAWREAQMQHLQDDASCFDLIVVGGGITGAGIYREAALRGLRVLLVEQRDFAWGTSSRSSKMVHGGLRYLGKGQFGLAKDSVTERQHLMQQLKGLVDPLPFLMGHYKGRFPGPWVFDKLLAIYDFFAGKKYRRFVASHINDYWIPGATQEDLIGATVFMDAVTDDARLVMRVLDEGNQHGGIALNYLRAQGIEDAAVPKPKHADSAKLKTLRLKDGVSEEEFDVHAPVVINAAGAWTDTLREQLGRRKQIRPLRGSHLVIPFWRLPVAFSISFFHPTDKRPVFVFPWEGQTVIGTTDLDHTGDLNQEAVIEQHELDYLLEAANHQFSKASLSESDVVASWAGVRPVVVEPYAHDTVDGMAEAKPSDEKREHMIWDDNALISIAGGKLTTFRLLALEVLQTAQPYLHHKLSPNDLNEPKDFEPIPASQEKQITSLGQQKMQRLRGRYGRNAVALVNGQDANALRTLGSSDTLLAELLWACRHEAVMHLDDLFLRRVRIGMLYPYGARDLIEPHKSVLCEALGWSEDRWVQEWTRYQAIIHDYYSLPRVNLRTDFQEAAGNTSAAS